MTQKITVKKVYDTIRDFVYDTIRDFVYDTKRGCNFLAKKGKKRVYDTKVYDTKCTTIFVMRK